MSLLTGYYNPPSVSVTGGVLKKPPTQRLGGEFARQFVTRGQVTHLADQATAFEGLRPQVKASIDNAVHREGRALQNAGALAVQQEFGDQESGAVTHGDVLNNTLKRAKARTGIALRGDAAIRNQQLKDRLTQVRSGIGASARAIDLQVQGQNIQAGVNVGVGDAAAAGRYAQLGSYGGAAGAFAGVLAGNKTNNGSFFDFGAKG